MPPCRTAVEMRGAAMPDSFATMASASSEVARCWASKSAGTYSASITGVIGMTLSRRTAPFQVCDSVAAVAIAGLARSVSARSIGTRIDLNICASCLEPAVPIYQDRAIAFCFDMSSFMLTCSHFPRKPCREELSMGGQGCPPASIVQLLLEQFRAGEAHEPATAERRLVPVLGRKI